jgi:hypothetical protein
MDYGLDAARDPGFAGCRELIQPAADDRARGPQSSTLRDAVEFEFAHGSAFRNRIQQSCLGRVRCCLDVVAIRR